MFEPGCKHPSFWAGSHPRADKFQTPNPKLKFGNMVTLPCISTNACLYKRLAAVIDSRPQDGYKLHLLSSLESAEEFLGAQTPELIFINFSATLPLLESPHSGLWLGNGGVIALCEECHTIDRINAVRDANILVSLTFADMEKQLPGILDIIRNNRPLLSPVKQPGPESGVLTGSFRLRNNLFEATCSINLICNYLYLSGKLTLDRKYFFNLPLYELLVNAIEHGNCGISYDEKSRFLERGGCAPDLIQEKCDDPAVSSKTVFLSYELYPSHARFVIVDMGKGFDWRTVLRTLPQKDLLRLHGRGILIARETARSMRYNEKGNEVILEIEYGSPAPGLCGLPRRD